jgi:Spy/CpxP family protein refolding chaperone
MASRTFEVFALACAVLTAFATASSAQITTPPATDSRMQTAMEPSPEGTRPLHEQGGGHRLFAEFSQIEETLTAGQKQQLSLIREQLRDELVPIRQQMKSIHYELTANPKIENADELRTKLTALQEEMRSELTAGRQRMLSVLSDQQRAELAKLQNAD